MNDALQLRADGGNVLLHADLSEATVRGLYAFGQTLFGLHAEPLVEPEPPPAPAP